MLQHVAIVLAAFTNPLALRSKPQPRVIMNYYDQDGFTTRDPSPSAYDANNANIQPQTLAEYLAERPHDQQGGFATPDAAASAVFSNPPGADGDFATPDAAATALAANMPIYDAPPSNPTRDTAPTAYDAYGDGFSIDPTRDLAPPAYLLPPAPMAADQAEDAAMPPLCPGQMCTIFSEADSWVHGRLAKVRGYDMATGMYHVWLDGVEPTGFETTFDRPILMLIHRKFLQ